jgi:hypothetical protein
VPHGGKRQRAGRPPGSLNKRHQITRAQIGHEDYSPLEYMLALMRDERAEATRRDAIAVQAANFLHPRLNAVATSNVNGGDFCGDVNIVTIVAVPRGGRVDSKTGTITVDGEVIADPPTVKPFEGTPALTDQREPEPIAEPAPLEPPLPVIELDTSNVTILRRREDDPA